MSTEIVPLEQSGQVMPPPPPVVVDETGLSDFVKLKPSRLALVQHTTTNPMGAAPGQILDSESGEAFNELPLVVLKMHQARVFFKPGQAITKGAEPLCRSWDGIKPAEDVKQRQSSNCASCPQAQWKGNSPSPCKLKLELVVSGLEDQMPHYLSVGGKSLSPIRKKMGEILKSISTGKIPSLHHIALWFKGVKDGTIYKLDVPKTQLLTPEEAAPHIALFKEIKSQSAKQEVIDAEFTTDDAVGEIVQGEIVEPTVPQQV